MNRAGREQTLLVVWLLILSGCAHFVFGWHTRSADGLILELLVGVLYIFTGGYLLVHPATGLASMAILLTIYLFLEAMLEFAMSTLAQLGAQPPRCAEL